MTCEAASDAVVDGGAVALMGNRLVVQLAHPPDYRPRPGGLHPRRSSRWKTCKAASDAVVNGGAVALMGNRLVVQLAPPRLPPAARRLTP